MIYLCSLDEGECYDEIKNDGIVFPDPDCPDDIKNDGIVFPAPDCPLEG